MDAVQVLKLVPYDGGGDATDLFEAEEDGFVFGDDTADPTDIFDEEDYDDDDDFDDDDYEEVE